MKEGGRN